MSAVRDYVGSTCGRRGSIGEELLLTFRGEPVAGRQRGRAFGARETAANTHSKFCQRLHARALKWKEENSTGETLLVVRIHVARHAAVADTVENARRVIH